MNVLVDKKIKFLASSNKLNKMEKMLGCVDGKIIGTGQADYTTEATTYNIGVGEKRFALIDVPGIEGKEVQYEEIIKNSLDRAHIIFYVNGSGKKIEKETLNKIKKYMHDGTSVYAIFNVHCKAKKERIKGIDKTFSEELASEFEKQEEIIHQTEVDLKFLGKNFVNSFSVNGLLAFCSLALKENGQSTIAFEKNKSTIADQKKYLNEYLGEKSLMLDESRIFVLENIINDKIEKFDDYIYRENIKKLKNRLKEVTEAVSGLAVNEKRKIKEFIGIYRGFQKDCENGKNEFISAVRYVAYNAVEDAFAPIESELLQMIEENSAKLNSSELSEHFESKKEDIVSSIQNKINGKMKIAQETYISAIENSQKRLMRDINREQIKFSISLSSEKILLDETFANPFKYSLKDLGKHLATIGSLTLSGTSVGSAIPAVGTLIGGIVGAVVGVIMSLWNIFASKEARIWKAKEKLHRQIEDIIYEISERLDEEIKKTDYENIINANNYQIINEIKNQIKSLEDVELILDSVLTELRHKYKTIR